jgi:hypothetical protein
MADETEGKMMQAVRNAERKLGAKHAIDWSETLTGVAVGLAAGAGLMWLARRPEREALARTSARAKQLQDELTAAQAAAEAARRATADAAAAAANAAATATADAVTNTGAGADAGGGTGAGADAGGGTGAGAGAGENPSGAIMLRGKVASVVPPLTKQELGLLSSRLFQRDRLLSDAELSRIIAFAIAPLRYDAWGCKVFKKSVLVAERNNSFYEEREYDPLFANEGLELIDLHNKPVASMALLAARRMNLITPEDDREFRRGLLNFNDNNQLLSQAIRASARAYLNRSINSDEVRILRCIFYNAPPNREYQEFVAPPMTAIGAGSAPFRTLGGAIFERAPVMAERRFVELCRTRVDNHPVASPAASKLGVLRR